MAAKRANFQASGLCPSSISIKTNSFSMARKTSKTAPILLSPFPKLEASGWQQTVEESQLFHEESALYKNEPHADSSTTKRSETHQERYKICVLCDKIFEGSIAFEEHLQSISHKKKTEGTFLGNVGDSTLHNSVEYNPGAVPKYYCTTCNKQCTDRIQYNEHILSDIHLKSKRNSEFKTKVKH
ncbi:hypothetical protein TNCT_239971 [Trichonephila clavata]|uniref:C2H2-type domain-containing protein n=1 Tax=Trichonephila clavata TaxID=2740835 RepID=A0A8X6IBW1_TRICU|nr:hypothetical protein TNCT_239971 [Trichonephila clavata]